MDRLAALSCSLLLLAVGCTSSGPEPRTCQRDEECGASATCVGGVCAENAAPQGSFFPPDGATTHRLIALEVDAADPEGHPVTYRWRVDPRTGGCPADVDAGDTATAKVVFWCPGSYFVTVDVADDEGRSMAFEAPMEVGESTGAPTVTAGAAISASHACDLAIPECRVFAPDGTENLALSASAVDLGGGPLTWEWVAAPPEAAVLLPGGGPTFSPDNLVAAPTASIANGGGALGGVYRFRVRARNVAGLIGQAFQEVVVQNTPPAAAPSSLSLDHVYADGLYVAEGEVDVGASDADGDALFAEASLAPAAAPGCEETAAPAAAGRIHVRIACSIPEALVGARTLAGTVTDVNGGAAPFSASISIANRPPVFAHLDGSAAGSITMGHRVEPCALATGPLCFIADGRDPFVGVDPDGDPLFGYLLGASVAASKTSSKGTVTLDDGGYRFRFETPTTLPTQFRTAASVTGFTLTATVTDAFGAAASVAEPLKVTNQPPIIAEAAPERSVNHTYDASRRRYLATAEGALFEDPDGDPLTATVAGGNWCGSVTMDGGRAVVGCERAWDYTFGGKPPLQEVLAPSTAIVTVSDGWGSLTSMTTVKALDRPAALSAPVSSVENCACVSGKYAASYTNLPVPVELTDPDGDPHLFSANPYLNLPQPVPVACVPGWCYPRVNGEPDSIATGAVSANPGPDTAKTSVQFRIAATCSVTGQACQ